MAHAAAVSLSRPIFTPVALASSSLSGNILSRHLIKNNSIMPVSINGEASLKDCQLAEDRLPISQYVIAGSCESVSAVYFTSDTSAENSDAITIPESTTVVILPEPLFLLTRKVSPTAKKPNSSAISCT